MRDLIEKLGLLEPVSNPSVGKLHQAEDGRKILQLVSEVTGFSQSALTGERRNGPLGKARQLVYLLCREHAQQLSTTQIGAMMNRDHTTIIHGIRKAAERVKSDPEYRETHNRILSRLAWEQ